MKYLTCLIALSLVLFMSSCKEAENPKTETANQEDNRPIIEGLHEGVAEEVIHTTAYTYLRVNESGGDVWIAVPKVDVQVGEKVKYRDPMPMPGFKSKELDRTFEMVYFAGGVIREDSAVEKNPAEPVVNADTEPRELPVPKANVDGTFTGVVTEVSHTSYTFLKLKQETAEFWVAIPKREIKVGETVTYVNPMEMRDFPSKGLNRVFDVIYFLDGVKTASDGEATADDTAKQADAEPAGKSDVVKISPVEGGVSIGDVFAKRDTYGGKVVRVRGKVTKVNKSIMGRNWVHLEDGTGGAGTNDLLVTTKELAAVGDVVTFEGKVTLNKDFGAGYSYEVLMEEGKIIAD